MNKIASFRLCKLSDEELLKKVDEGTDNIFKTGIIPSCHIPARPDSDYDLLVGELLLRFKERLCPPPVSAEVVSHNEWFNSQSDIRQLLLLHPDGEMIESSCLHFLGDDAQSWWAKRKASPSAPVVAEGGLKNTQKESK